MCKIAITICLSVFKVPFLIRGLVSNIFALEALIGLKILGLVSFDVLCRYNHVSVDDL